MPQVYEQRQRDPARYRCGLLCFNRQCRIESVFLERRPISLRC